MAHAIKERISYEVWVIAGVHSFNEFSSFKTAQNYD